MGKSQVCTVRVSLIGELLKEHRPRFVVVVNTPPAACYRAALGKAQDMEQLKERLSFRERREIFAPHWVNSLRCAREDRDEDMLVVHFEDLLQEPEWALHYIQEANPNEISVVERHCGRLAQALGYEPRSARGRG